MIKIASLIESEERRQKETISLIPSENYVSQAVREAMRSMLGNKYSEGYPGRRYYQGNKIIDEIEQTVIDLAKQVFDVPHANVQPYSGSPANSAILMALAEPGQTIMGMKLSAGGHLTHGHPQITFSGRYYHSVQFDVDEKGWLDYGEIEVLAESSKPKIMMVGTTAYPRLIDWEKLAEIATKAGAFLAADISHIAGLIVSGANPSPVEFADVIMTTTHKTLRGPRGAMIMVTRKGLERDPELGKKIDKAVFPGLQGGPHDNTIAAIGVALEEAESKEFRKYGQQVVKNASVLAETLRNMNFDLCTGGTDNHLLVIDLRKQNIGGKEAAVLLEEAGIIVNANTVPHDTNPPMKPSGVRVGTPAVTTRGMKEMEMKTIAEMIEKVIKGREVEGVKLTVGQLVEKFPIL